jgi:hypothetical protein
MRVRENSLGRLILGIFLVASVYALATFILVTLATCALVLSSAAYQPSMDPSLATGGTRQNARTPSFSYSAHELDGELGAARMSGARRW